MNHKAARFVNLLVPVYILVVCFIGYLLRTSWGDSVFIDGMVIFQDSAPYYHMRRVFATMLMWPSTIYFDTAVNYPYGDIVPWPPLFDFAIAALCRAIGLGVDDINQVETLSAYVSPVIGALTCIPVYFITKLVFGRSRALVATGVMALIPAHIWYSRIGYTDHPVAVTMTQLIMFYLVLVAMEVRSDPSSGIVRRLITGLLPVAPMWVGMMIWTGYIAHIAILDVYLLIVLFMEFRNGQNRFVRFCWITHFLTALSLYSFVHKTIVYGGLHFTLFSLSYFHIAAICLFGFVCVMFEVFAILYSSDKFKKYRWIPAIIGAGMVLAFIYSQALLLVEGLLWILGMTPLAEIIAGAKPMIWDFTASELLDAIAKLTGFFIVFPIALICLATHQYDNKLNDRKIIFVVLWGFTFFFMAIMQNGLAQMFAPAGAMLAGWFVFEFHARAKKLLQNKKYIGSISGVVPFMALIVFSYYALVPYIVDLPNPLWALGKRHPIDISKSSDYDFQTYNFMKKFRKLIHQNDKSRLHPNESDNFGVMIPWNLGFKMMYLGGAKVISDNFGRRDEHISYIEWAIFYASDDEGEMLKIISDRRIKYIIANFKKSIISDAAIFLKRPANEYYRPVITESGVFIEILERPTLIQSMFYRFNKLIASETIMVNRKNVISYISALDHFRLLLDSENDEFDESWKVYEFVSGARVTIKVPISNREFEIEYSFISDVGRHRVYKKTVYADFDGTITTLLPYSSELPKFGHTSLYKLTGDIPTREFFISEEVIQEGKYLTFDFRN